MTITTLIATNAVLAALLVFAIVRLLHHGIRSDHQAHGELEATLRSLPRHERQKIAA